MITLTEEQVVLLERAAAAVTTLRVDVAQVELLERYLRAVQAITPYLGLTGVSEGDVQAAEEYCSTPGSTDTKPAEPFTPGESVSDMTAEKRALAQALFAPGPDIGIKKRGISLGNNAVPEDYIKRLMR